jgi:telomerase reverse transcriptase
MAKLKEVMFEEVKGADAARMLDARALGFSQVRLLPKGKVMRPITNLRKRTLGTGRSKILGPSINSVLSPLHSMLKLEKEMNPSRLGATMFSVNDIYGRLKAFKEGLGNSSHKLYFAKVDVRAAFDTLPQDAVLSLMGSIPSQDEYIIAKHVEVKPGELEMSGPGAKVPKPIRRWLSSALVESGPETFPGRLEDQLGRKSKNTVFIDRAVRSTHPTGQLLALLRQHVSQNLIKIGKKFYRQKRGIPQGSVLSAILCNYFYADLEAHHLDFLDGAGCLLMRLIDDFLLITTDRAKAVRFVEIMHGGLPEYGVEINPQKTLVNFDMVMGQEPVGKLADRQWFPYCGTVINCKTLEITKDSEKRRAMGRPNS